MTDPKPWEEPSRAPRFRAQALLAAIDGRKTLKRLGRWLDAEGDGALRQALVDEGRGRGTHLPDDAVDWPGKKLLRRAQARDQGAQVRTTPIARDEAFTCMGCGKAVPIHGRTARDHCPWCLRSRHVDDAVPGDRASDCGGRLDPHGVEVAGHEVVILYACTRCGAEKRNKALLDGDVPDDWEALVAISSGRLG